MHEIKVRPAVPEDVPLIREITHEAFQKYAFDLGRPIAVKALSDTEGTILEELGAKRILVGELNGDIVGSIRYEFINNVAYFSRFGVRLKAQSCGMGRALVQAVVNEAREAGCRAVALHTSAQMSSLIRFYYGQGFFIHSVNTSAGYYRALLIRLLTNEKTCFDYAALLPGK